MQHYLFESIVLSAVLAGGGFVVLLIVGRGMEPQRRGKLWLILMFSVVGLFLLQKIVVTDREAVYGQFRKLVSAVERRDFESMQQLAVIEYEHDGLNRDELIGWIRGQLTNFGISSTWVHSFDTQIDGENAVSDMSASATVSVQGMMAGRHTGVWRFEWVRRDGQWLLTALQPVEMDGRPVSKLGEIRPERP